MTFNKYAIKYLTDRGMFPGQAAELLEKARDSPSLQFMTDLWNDSMENYPPSMVVGICMALDRIALEWIDSNLPLAGYRSMFDAN
jgi:hypothetical protein